MYIIPIGAGILELITYVVNIAIISLRHYFRRGFCVCHLVLRRVEAVITTAFELKAYAFNATSKLFTR